MTRSRYLATLLLLVFCVTAGAQSFSDAKKSFESAFRPEKRFTERIDAVFAVANFETRDSAKLLLNGVVMTDALLNPLHERKGEVDEEIERHLGPKMMDEQRTLPTAVNARIRVLKRETARLQEEIDGELKVFQAIEDGLASMRAPEVVEHLARSALSRGKVWKTREIAARVLGEIGDPTASKFLVRALRDKDGRVQVAVARAVGKMGIKEGMKELLALLKEKSWTLRSAAIEALGGIGVKEAVGPLIDQLEKEEGRLQRDCANALARLTGEDLGPVPSAWRRWWEDHKDEYGGDAGKELGGHPVAPPGGRDRGYYGIPIETKHAIFILDVSGSMAKSAKDSSREPQGGEVSKIDSAKAELIRALKSFPSSGSFNLVIFNDIVKRWKEKMVPSNAAMKKEVANWVKGLQAASSTNIYDALDSAFRVTGMGARDKNYDLGADTIFLLSDGSPTKPDGTADDWEKILRAVNEWNRLKRVVVHTIGIGGHNAAFMSRLARENGGTYVAR